MKWHTHFHHLPFVLLILLLLISIPVSAADLTGTLESGQTWDFDVSTGTLTITGTGDLPDYPYSSSLEHQAPWKVWENDIKTVILSEGITDTGDCTFHMLENLTEIKLPSTLRTIGANAFSGAEKLKEVVIPDSVTAIGDSAFRDCKSLGGINLPPDLLTIGNRAFYNCKAIVSVTIPASVTLIDTYAFKDCENLEEVTILGAPKFGFEVMSVSKLVRFCADPPGFESDSLEDVGAECYYPQNNTAWASVVTQTYGGELDWVASEDPANVKMPSFDDTKSGSCGPNATWSLTSGVLTVSGSGKMETARWARYGEEIQEVVIQEGITELSAHAFMNCTNLKTVTLPNTLTSLSAGAFNGCSSLSSISLPARITEIHWYTFHKCTALKEIVIPSGVTFIGEYAFYDTGLEKITLSDSLTEIKQSAFASCNKLEEIHFPASLTTLGDGSFSGCTGLRNLYFAGNPPKHYNFTFRDVEATAYYPAGNELWENGGLAYHGGRIFEKPITAQNPCGHIYGDWTVTLQPTTETPGQKQRACISCGHMQSSEISVIEGTSTTPPATNPSTPPATEPSTAPSTEPSSPPATQPSNTAPSTESSSSPETQPSSTSPAPTQPVVSENVPKENNTALVICIGLAVIIGGSTLWFFLRKRK